MKGLRAGFDQHHADGVRAQHAWQCAERAAVPAAHSDPVALRGLSTAAGASLAAELGPHSHSLPAMPSQPLHRQLSGQKRSSSEVHGSPTELGPALTRSAPAQSALAGMAQPLHQQYHDRVTMELTVEQVRFLRRLLLVRHYALAVT